MSTLAAGSRDDSAGARLLPVSGKDRETLDDGHRELTSAVLRNTAYSAPAPPGGGPTSATRGIVMIYVGLREAMHAWLKPMTLEQEATETIRAIILAGELLAGERLPTQGDLAIRRGLLATARSQKIA